MSVFKFRLNFEKKLQACLFSLPQNNQYQQISNFKIIGSENKITIDQNNIVIVFTNTDISSVSFLHKPAFIKKNIDRISVIQLSNNFDLQHDSFIDYQDRQMRELANQWLEGIDTTNANLVLKVLYQKTLNYLQYGNPIPGLHPYSQAFQDRVTDCGGFSTFLATLLQTQKIPCRLVVGYLYKLGWKYKIKEKLQFPKSFSDITMHAWLEVQQTDGDWFPVDPSVEWKRVHGLSQCRGGFGYIPADRLVLSFGHNLKFTWKKKGYVFPILQHPEVII